jgi:hypothetical protein
MKYLKLFEGYQSESEVQEICKRYSIQNCSINSDGLVDVDGDVYLGRIELTELPLQFGKVTGYFYCECKLNNLNPKNDVNLYIELENWHKNHLLEYNSNRILNFTKIKNQNDSI